MSRLSAPQGSAQGAPRQTERADSDISYQASQLQAPSSPTVRECIKKMQLHHLNAALTAFDGFGFMTPPSLLLLQTLLTGVSMECLLMRNITHTSRVF
jgi:hypothetical protein